MQSYLTESEQLLLSLSDLDRATPYVIRGVVATQLSIARYYGCIDFNCRRYVYRPETDELIRSDVMRWLEQHRKEQRHARALQNAAAQGALTLGDL